MALVLEQVLSPVKWENEIQDTTSVAIPAFTEKSSGGKDPTSPPKKREQSPDIQVIRIRRTHSQPAHRYEQPHAESNARPLYPGRRTVKGNTKPVPKPRPSLQKATSSTDLTDSRRSASSAGEPQVRRTQSDLHLPLSDGLSHKEPNTHVLGSFKTVVSGAQAMPLDVPSESYRRNRLGNKLKASEYEQMESIPSAGAISQSPPWIRSSGHMNRIPEATPRAATGNVINTKHSGFMGSKPTAQRSNSLTFGAGHPNQRATGITPVSSDAIQPDIGLARFRSVSRDVHHTTWRKPTIQRSNSITFGTTPVEQLRKNQRQEMLRTNPVSTFINFRRSASLTGLRTQQGRPVDPYLSPARPRMLSASLDSNRRYTQANLRDGFQFQPTSAIFDSDSGHQVQHESSLDSLMAGPYIQPVNAIFGSKSAAYATGSRAADVRYNNVATHAQFTRSASRADPSQQRIRSASFSSFPPRPTLEPACYDSTISHNHRPAQHTSFPVQRSMSQTGGAVPTKYWSGGCRLDETQCNAVSTHENFRRSASLSGLPDQQCNPAEFNSKAYHAKPVHSNSYSATNLLRSSSLKRSSAQNTVPLRFEEKNKGYSSISKPGQPYAHSGLTDIPSRQSEFLTTYRRENQPHQTSLKSYSSQKHSYANESRILNETNSTDSALLTNISSHTWSSKPGKADSPKSFNELSVLGYPVTKDDYMSVRRLGHSDTLTSVDAPKKKRSKFVNACLTYLGKMMRS